jgi:hypothetical protein
VFTEILGSIENFANLSTGKASSSVKFQFLSSILHLSEA